MRLTSCVAAQWATVHGHALSATLTIDTAGKAGLDCAMDAFREPNAVQLHVALDDIEPAVWRRLVVPWAWNLGQLHLVIQAAFSWWNAHLHEFSIGGLRHGDPAMEQWADETSARSFDEGQVRLLDFACQPGLAFTYSYDFGDNWQHTITVETISSLEQAPRSAVCIDGARARPPEDVGGVPGYEDFLTVMSDPEEPEHRDIKRWCGGHFDPEWFDLPTVDKDVRNALKPGVRRRLHQPKPKRAKQGA